MANDIFKLPSDEEINDSYDLPSDEELGSLPELPEGTPILPVGAELEAQKEIVRQQEEQNAINASKMGPIEAASLHVAPFDTTGIIGGISGAAGQAVGDIQEGRLPKLEELKKTYYEAKEGTQKRQEQALEEQPAASLGGMMAGGTISMGAGNVASKIPQFGKYLSAVMPSVKSAEKAQRIANVAKKAKDLEHLHKTYQKLAVAASKAKIASGIAEGAKFGGLTALGGGNAKLLEGDIAGTLEETAKGVGFGAGIGGIFSSGFEALSGIKGLFKTKGIVEPYRLGAKGMDLSTNERVNLSKKLSKSIHADLVDEFQKLGSSRSEALKLADEMGARINTIDDVGKAIKIIDDLALTENSSDAKAFVSILKKHLGTSQQMSKVEEQMEKKLTQIYQKEGGLDEIAARKLAKKELNDVIKTGGEPNELLTGKVGMKDVYPDSPYPEIESKVLVAKPQEGATKVLTADASKVAPQISKGVDPDTGLEFMAIKDSATGKSSILVAGKPVPQLAPEGATLEQVNALRKSLDGFTFKNAGNSVPHDVKKQATELRKLLSSMIDSELVGVTEGQYSGINKKFANLYSALEQAGIKQKPMQYGQLYKEQLRSLANLFESQSDEKLTYKYIADFMSELKKGAPDIYNKNKKAVDDLRILARYAEDPSKKDLGVVRERTAIIGTIGEQIHKLANRIGREVKNVSDITGEVKNYVSSGVKKIVSSSPEEIQKLIGKVESGGEKYKQFLVPLQKLKTSKPQTKNAILYSLMQNPSFRELISADEKEK